MFLNYNTFDAPPKCMYQRYHTPLYKMKLTYDAPNPVIFKLKITACFVFKKCLPLLICDLSETIFEKATLL